MPDQPPTPAPPLLPAAGPPAWEWSGGRDTSDYFAGHTLPPDASTLKLLGVDYVHLKVGGNDDLYVTRHGLPFLEHLRPENWYEKQWFEQRRERLSGTSMVYKVLTKPVRGVGKALVVKWCRVGEVVPMDTFTLTKFSEAEFNSPYEEFALVMEMRDLERGTRVRTHKPLAIYVPAKRSQTWQICRLPSKMAQKKARYRDVELDIDRQYILIYEWIKGRSVAEALRAAGSGRKERELEEGRLTARAAAELHGKGYFVLDMKPEHIIVRTRPDGTLLRARDGAIPYALVDFELLLRTPAHEERVQALRRAEYLTRQRDRFATAHPDHFPPHLHPVNVLGVDYVYGHTESTQGTLWVVGRDPTLFDYFQPERWRRTPRTNLSRTNQVFHTLTKDRINLVWKMSRVGEWPDGAGPEVGTGARPRPGFNSPFEEFALALELGRSGLPGVYPRAIYMTGLETTTPEEALDPSRYASHRGFLTPEGWPVLRSNRLYITIWGFWNGLDELLARQDAEYCTGIDALAAREQGLIDDDGLARLLDHTRARLQAAGLESPALKGSHLLLTRDAAGNLWRDEAGGLPAVRLCNFEQVGRRAPA